MPQGSVVPYQNKIAPMEGSTIANINRGLPAKPVNMPKIGTQTATVTTCRKPGLEVPGHCFPRIMITAKIQIATLTSGVHKPIKLARDRQLQRSEVLKYITQPHSRTSGDNRQIALIIAH